MKLKSSVLAAVVCALFGIAQTALAQTTTGEISGRITDNSGAIIRGAEVVAVNEDTGVERKTVSNDEGYYSFTFLPLGTYSVGATSPGFKRTTQPAIRIGAGQRVNVSMTLELGAVSESVTVAAVAQQVNTEDAKVRHVIDQKQAQDLALNGRILTHMLALIPGVALTRDLNAFDITGALGAYAVNGSRTTFNAATVDGGFNQDSGNYESQTNLVSPDFVQEVTIVTSGYTADYGRNSGVQINFSTRSGTKDFHGVAYEFFRHDRLDARSFFAPRKEKLRYHDFGWTLGGPVTIPGKFNTSREKLFFFAGQEYRRRSRDQIFLATTPTTAERSGIINTTVQLVYPPNFPVQALRGQPIMDPSRATPSNPQGRNVIPQQYITANGRSIMNIYEEMTKQAGIYRDEPIPNNTTFQLPNPDRRREDIVKIDYQHSEQHQLTYTMMYGTGSNDTRFVQGPYPTKGFTRRNKARTHRVNWTHVISPTSVNKVTAQVNHLDIRWPPYLDWDAASHYGLAPRELFGNDIQELGIPQISILGFSAISGGAGPWLAPTADFSVMDDFQHIRGAHSIKFGFLGVRNRKNEADNTTSRTLMANVSFSPVGNTITSGDALADALLGNFRSWRESEYAAIVGVRYSIYEAYITDTWKAKPNLSFDFGVRYNHTAPAYAAANNVATFLPEAFDFSQAQRVVSSGTGAGSLVPGIGRPYNGLVIPGNRFHQDFEQRFSRASSPEVKALFRPDLPRGIYDKFNVFTPRFGFAWDPSKTGAFSIRGGAGFFTDNLRSGLLVGQAGNPPFTPITEVLDGPFDDPSRGAPGAGFPVAVRGARTDIEAPITLKANFGIQTQVGFNSIVDVNYVTSQGRHLLRTVDINQIHPATQINNRNVNLNALRQYPGYTSINMYESSAASNYHGLQVGLTRRYQKGFTYSVAYTFSKALDDGATDGTGVQDINNYRAERSHSDLDRNHVLMMSYIYELPFWRQRDRWYEKAFGGWMVSGINQFQTGPWLTPSIATPTGNRRPDWVGQISYLDPREVRTLVGGDGQPRSGNFYFDPTPGAVFVAPPPDRFGNAAPRIIRGPGRNNWNITLTKDFLLNAEGVRLKFRAEAYNIWNHAQFNNPDMTASSRTYGIISSAADGRNVQLGLKLEW
jgi:hypothetical protein